jgi:predicted  nucleic acid-binding Zn-ribbon protein
MKSFDQQEKDKKYCLDNLSDYKEYQAIKAEVESIQRMQIEQEKIVLDAWNQLENAQSDFKKKKQESVEQAEKLQQKLNEMQQKQKELSMDFYKLVEQRKVKEGLVPVEWLEKYEMMRSRVADPVVQVAQDSCGACWQMLTSQDLVRAKRGALIQCKKCFRLLYLPEIMGM